MPEELGRIEKPLIEEFRTGRKLYFVPLIYPLKEAEYQKRCNKYWEQLENQVADLELKLGKVSRIYHEFVSVAGEDAVKAVEELNEKSCQIVKKRLEQGAQFEPIEDGELLAEFMDWSRCLAIGLQNQKVFIKIYEFYAEASKKRNEHIAKQIDDTLKKDEIGILLMREGHQVQFPSDIRVFYVAPPALDELKRWLRDQETKAQQDK